MKGVYLAIVRARNYTATAEHTQNETGLHTMRYYKHIHKTHDSERTINPMYFKDLYEFRNVHGHYEVYEKSNGSFVVSADTYREAVESLLEILSEQ